MCISTSTYVIFVLKSFFIINRRKAQREKVIKIAKFAYIPVCANPFYPKHEHNRTSNLKRINNELKVKVEVILRRKLSECERLCVSCFRKARLDVQIESEIISNYNEEPENESDMCLAAEIQENCDKDENIDICPEEEHDLVLKLSSIIGSFDASPIKCSKLIHKKYSQEKLEKVTKLFSEKIFKRESITEKYYREIIEQLQNKFKLCKNFKEIHGVLSALPKSMTISEICSLFNVSEHIARRSKSLQNKNENPIQKQGHRINEEIMVKFKLIY